MAFASSRSSAAATPLHLAVRDPERLQKLIENELPGYIEKKQYMDGTDGSAGSILQCAVLAGNVESARILLEFGADINEQDALGRTPLIHACSEGNEELARFLVSAGADFNVQDHDGQNCAHCAFCMDHIELGNWLVEQVGVDSAAMDADGNTPLDWRRLHDLGDDDALEAKVQQLELEQKHEDRAQGGSSPEKDEVHELEERKLAEARKESNAFVINGEENNFAAGTGLRATRWLRKSDNGVICCDE